MTDLELLGWTVAAAILAAGVLLSVTVFSGILLKFIRKQAKKSESNK
ncbi:MAG: hypothetical protein ACRDAO_01535 [Culicoidibacterales bacterium]